MHCSACSGQLTGPFPPSLSRRLCDIPSEGVMSILTCWYQGTVIV